MRELIACWQNTRMIVLIGLCAALYAAVFFMFSWIPIIPGLTQFRPAASLPVVFSVFFGPVAAWGTAFGNVLGDLISGTISPGSLFGIAGNFIYGYAPYRVLRAYARPEETPIGALLFAIFLASVLCAEIIALGVQAAGLAPFSFLANVILLNNIVMSLILAPLLIRGLQGRIRGMKMGYMQTLEAAQISRPLFGKAGAVFLFAVAVAIYAIMMVPSIGQSLASSAKFQMASSIGLTILSLLLL